MLIPLTLFMVLYLPDNCFVDSHLHNGDNSVVAVEDVGSVMQKIESSCRWVNLFLQFHQINLSLKRNLNHHFVNCYHQVLNYYWELPQGLQIPLSCRLIFLQQLLVLLCLIQRQDPFPIIVIVLFFARFYNIKTYIWISNKL